MRSLQLMFVGFLGGCSLLFLGLDRCGDGALSSAAGELCDDGNGASGDGCDEACQIEIGFSCPTPGEACLSDALCGDGIVDAGEACDDANTSDTDACTNLCQAAVCGDGFIQAGVETCDPPDAEKCNAQCQVICQLPTDCADNDACTINEDCVNSVCVNTAVDPDDNDPCTSDSCDPVLGVGNEVQPDGFVCAAAPRSICLLGVCGVSLCGDGFVDPATGEQCDDGNAINTDSCPNDCTSATCADGVIEGAETCDDGNNTPGDGCDAACQVEGVCGNGVLEPGEQCDDGNLTNADGCEGGCQFVCGANTNPTRAVQNGATCLLFFNQPLGWVAAEADCVALGGHLASIASNTENNRVDVARGSANPITWVGLNDIAVEAIDNPDGFVWTDGTPSNFDNFDAGEPNDGGNQEDCVEMIESAEWNDNGCNEAKPYVCEI